MNTDTILVIIPLISFVASVLMVGGLEYLIKRYKAHKQYLRGLQVENQRLKRVLNLYELELTTKEVIK